jgi:pyridoxamine 5'-phosphate oxidase
MKDLRREYASRILDESAIDPDPVAQFRLWFADALDAQIVDANAMSLATASLTGEPSVRSVLLKDVGERGFVFFTHYDSPKGRDLAANPRASLLFYWAALERQVRISGMASRVPREESEAYFASRPLVSQWAAWAAKQSTELSDRATLERGYEEAQRRYPSPPIPCPPFWGGYCVTPEYFEFWQGRPGRLHDRIAYSRLRDASWSRARLAP